MPACSTPLSASPQAAVDEKTALFSGTARRVYRLDF